MDKQHGIDIKINNTETTEKPLIRISPIHMQHGIDIKQINDTDTTEKILEEFNRKIKEMQEEFNRKLKEERAATDEKLQEEHAANAAVNLKLKKELVSKDHKLNLANKIISRYERRRKIKNKSLSDIRECQNNLTKNKIMSSIRRMLNQNQLEALILPSSRGKKWSADILKKSFKLKFACGSARYEELRKQNIPLPSQSTLRAALQKIDFIQGKYDDIMEMLAGKAAHFEDNRQLDCVLSMDEMAITSGKQLDPSTNFYCGMSTFPTRDGIS